MEEMAGTLHEKILNSIENYTDEDKFLLLDSLIPKLINSREAIVCNMVRLESEDWNGDFTL